MARFTTDFLTWLKGLFHTKTEINTLLDKKINTVEVQGKITSFTNKDRITLERLIERMNNPDSKALFLRPTDSSLPDYTFCENIKVATTYNGGVSLYLDGAAIGTSASSVVLKKIDGTKIGDFNKRGTDPAGWAYSSASALLGVGIHYLYAEATFPDGSVRKSNILTVFVKDTNNKFSHNLWSGGEYLNTPGVAGINVTSITTNELSYIGENSIKTLIKNIGSDAYIEKESQLEFNENGKSVYFQCYIYTIKDVSLRIYYRVNGSYQVQSVDVPAGSDGLFSVAASIPSTADIVKYRISFIDKTADACLYTDDWSLTVS